jgi:hypothetical protein
MLLNRFPDLESMAVIDLGGVAWNWQQAPVQPALVHIINLEDPPDGLPTWIRAEKGNACDLPARIISSRYDLAFSNSVIEHVGGHAARQRLADAVHALAPRHWVQTPYRYFPLEPHWLFPGMQFLPIPAKAQIARSWPLAPARGVSRERAIRDVMGTELIGRSQMRAYFPDSQILTEKAAGLVKSLISVRDECR